MSGRVAISEDDFRQLAAEQGALRRVATLVAGGAGPGDVFAAVSEEVGRLLGAAAAGIGRYDENGTLVILGSWRADGAGSDVIGVPIRLDGDSAAARVRRTGRLARMETYADAGGEIARRMREEWGDFQQTIGAPIIVGGELWGVMVISRSRGDPFPVGTEEDRLASFTELIAIAVSNAAGAEQLAASRARVVAAADESRRRIERDLHDGAQQRLVSLALRLRSAQQRFADQPEVAAEFATAVEALTAILENLREISHGLHPAILSKSGLAAALKTLARRSAVPVRLDITLDRRLPDAVEVAAYYVVCEALANAVKHAVASTIDVAAHAEDDTLLISVRDDGVGGASAARGSGITGLRDRVEALGGTLEILSVPEQGTSLTARLPMRLGTLD